MSRFIMKVRGNGSSRMYRPYRGKRWTTRLNTAAFISCAPLLRHGGVRHAAA